MRRKGASGGAFGWLWTAYAVSAYGTGLGFGAFSIVAIEVLGAGPARVAALSASGLAIGALLAIPLGPLIEFRAKRPIMITADLVRFAALASIPFAYLLGMLSFTQLLVVAVITATAKIAFTAASGAYLKTVVADDRLLVATSRFESTTWSATIIGPPLGGAAIGLFGPAITVLVDGVSYLLSALAVTAIREPEPRPAPKPTATRWHDIVEGWRYILAHPTLRPLFFNTVLVNGLIMATEPLLAVLMLSHMGFPAWQYGLTFAVPCVGGLIGSRLARRVVSRYGERRVLRGFGALRVCWPIGLVFVQPGPVGLLIVMATQFGLIVCASIFTPAVGAYRLRNTDDSRRARVLTAWTITGSLSTALITVTWGLLAGYIGPRAAIAAAGILLLATPFLLPKRVSTRADDLSVPEQSPPRARTTAP